MAIFVPPKSPNIWRPVRVSTYSIKQLKFGFTAQGGTRSEKWWGCAAGRWKLDPKDRGKNEIWGLKDRIL